MKAASFSTITAYERCPHTRRLHLDGVRQYEDPDSPMARGITMHEQAEAFLKGDGPLPEWPYHLDVLQNWAKVRDQLQIEQTWFFNDKWEPVDAYKDSWLVMKLDLVSPIGGALVDWKSGRPNEIKHAFQGQLYAAGADARYPGLPNWHVAFIYLDCGKTKGFLLQPDQIAKAREKWTHRIHKMNADDRLLPRPSKSNCRWCGYRHVCEYSESPIK